MLLFVLQEKFQVHLLFLQNVGILVTHFVINAQASFCLKNCCHFLFEKHGYLKAKARIAPALFMQVSGYLLKNQQKLNFSLSKKESYAILFGKFGSKFDHVHI